MDSAFPSNQLHLLEERLGHVFHVSDRLAAALTHPSFAAENAPSGNMENQRLEFLGDAVLGVVCAEWLLVNRPEWREGTLTKVRSRLTNTTTLAGVARRLELGEFLRLGRGEQQQGGREKAAVLADALEAVLAALWLDGGPESVRRFFQVWFAPDLAEALEAGRDDNPKGELQERLQQDARPSPRYEILEESGPPHDRRFRVAVCCAEDLLALGCGNSKREAEMQAARLALATLSGTGKTENQA